MALLRDFRYAVRVLGKDLGFTIVAVLALALGIGGNTAIFTVVDAVILRPLPYPDPDRLVMVYESRKDRGNRNVISPANYLDWRARNTVFENLAALIQFPRTLSGAGDPESVQGMLVTANFFPTIGVQPILGRAFTPADETPQSPRVVLISHRLWERRFGRDPKAPGRPLVLDGEPATVVGVMPPGFQFLSSEVEFWTPARFDPALDYRQVAGRSWFAVGRLKPGITPERAHAEMVAIARALESEYPAFNTNWTAMAVPLHEVITGKVRTALWVLLGAVGLVLVIACANIANLLLSRAAARRREMAVRSSLGARPSRLFGQLLTESLTLSGLGGLAGLGLAIWGIDILLGLAPDAIPRLAEVGLNARVFVFTLLVSAVAGIAFGLIPALQAARANLADTLKDAGRSNLGARSRRLPNAIVAAEVAFSVVLLIGAGLLVRSFVRLVSVDPGFEAEGLLTARAQVTSPSYEDSQIVSFFREAIGRLESLPGVRSASATVNLPMGGFAMATRFRFEGRPDPLPGEEPTTHVRIVAPNYFRTMGIRQLRGRDFNQGDRADTPRVFVVNETFVKKFFPEDDPIGRRISVNMQREDPFGEIVGVVGAMLDQSLEESLLPTVFYPHAQFPFPAMTFVARTAGDPASFSRAVSGIVRSIDPNVPVSAIRPMEAVLAESLARQRFNTLLLSLFAGLALLLAVVGVYGVASYSVAQRTREIGVRMAIGADRSEVMRMVLRQGLAVAAAGLAIGLAAAFALTRLMTTLLFQVRPGDPVTFVTSALLLLAVAALAVYVPARRATRVDPATVLRWE